MKRSLCSYCGLPVLVDHQGYLADHGVKKYGWLYDSYKRCVGSGIYVDDEKIIYNENSGSSQAVISNNGKES